MTAPSFLQESITFDGEDDYIELPEMEFDFSSGMTMEAWAYYESLPTEAIIINLDNPIRTSTENISFGSSAAHGIGITTQGSGFATLQKIEELEKWIHIVVTISPSRSSIVYQNGSQIVQRFVDLPINLKRTLNCIGRHSKFDEDFFHGRLGEIRIWNIARSEAEIIENMNRRLTGNEPGLVGYWPLNERYGTVAYDKSSNNYHGTIHGQGERERVTREPLELPANSLDLAAKKVELNRQFSTSTPQYQTIPNDPPEYPGMNFALLREEGIKHIEKLAGQVWTDYNTHDPGITILEALCYGITDLSYRLSFPIQDLLASPPAELEEDKKQFFTARQILTTNPLTVNDYRKLLIDIDGVQNVWLRKVQDTEPKIYYNTTANTLNFDTTDLPEYIKLYSEPIQLNGLYQVLIAKEEEADEVKLQEEVTLRLHQHRNLCEDFQEISILPKEEITVKAEIEIEEGLDLVDLMAQIYFGLDCLISPSIDFFTLRELLEKGKSTADIFAGPPLEHGFIDDEQLQLFERKWLEDEEETGDELHTSDMIHIILDLEGVKAVKSIFLSSSKSSDEEEWALELDINSTPRLKDVEGAIEDISFFKGSIPCQLDQEEKVEVAQKVQTLHQEYQRPYSKIVPKDLPIPAGQDRELSEYESIQNDFPPNYGIGEFGLPRSASAKRKAQAKQLQAYLLFYDQLLANNFAQLDHVKDLFSFHKQDNKTYFSQEVSSLSQEVRDLLQEYPSETEDDQKIDIERRNRFLNYLIGQYCEKFTDYSLLLYKSILEEKLIEDKLAFLRDYPRISADRGKAFNRIDYSQIWDTDNVSGLKLRISRLLGIPETRQSLASGEIEGFHLVEHILLRPRATNVALESAEGLTFAQPMQFTQSTVGVEQVTCLTQVSGLVEGDEVKIFDAGAYNGIYPVTNVQLGGFDIEAAFAGERTGKWAKADQYADPFSFQMSFVFPAWLPRFQEETFQQLIQETLINETPAHITIYLHWFDQEEMATFELAYEQWLEVITDEAASDTEVQIKTNNLIRLLKIAYPELVLDQIPKGIGYMVIEGTPREIFHVI
ncbi:MAG: LamG-like jellyroll fold domain-containing protein [Cyanobacteria bacterium P01_F01_bin.150]